MLNLPKITGHRGAAEYAPENTLAGIHTAADMGLEWIELDIQLSKGGVPVLFHDETLERTTNGHGLLAETSWEDLQKLDAGSYMSESFAATRIPSLEQALDAIIERGLGVNFELKCTPDNAKELAESAMDIISRVWDEPEKILISSLNADAIESAHDYAESYPRALILEDATPDWEKLVAHLNLSALCLKDCEALTNEFTLRSFQKSDLKILVWTINDDARAQALYELGIDSIITDVPDIIDI